MIEEIILIFFSILLILSALMVVTVKNPVHSVFFLILVYFSSSAIFIIFHLEFLAVILIVIYAGAIAVLFLFVVMMLNIRIIEQSDKLINYLPLGIFSCSFFFFFTYYIFISEQYKIISKIKLPELPEPNKIMMEKIAGESKTTTEMDNSIYESLFDFSNYFVQFLETIIYIPWKITKIVYGLTLYITTFVEKVFLSVRSAIEAWPLGSFIFGLYDKTMYMVYETVYFFSYLVNLISKWFPQFNESSNSIDNFFIKYNITTTLEKVVTTLENNWKLLSTQFWFEMSGVKYAKLPDGSYLALYGPPKMVEFKDRTLFLAYKDITIIFDNLYVPMGRDDYIDMIKVVDKYDDSFNCCEPKLLFGSELFKDITIYNSWISKFYEISNIEMFAQTIYTYYIPFFLVSGIILLAAMIGSIILTLDQKMDVKRQQIYQQIERNLKESIKIKQ